MKYTILPEGFYFPSSGEATKMVMNAPLVEIHDIKKGVRFLNLNNFTITVEDSDSKSKEKYWVHSTAVISRNRSSVGPFDSIIAAADWATANRSSDDDWCDISISTCRLL